MRPWLALCALMAASVGAACQPAGDSTPGGTPGYDAGTGSDATADGPVVTQALRVGTFNIRLFFDSTCDSGQCGASDFEQAPSKAAFDARADEVADAIRALNADVISVQEIETQVSMDALSSRLKDLYPTAVFGETGAPGSVDVAVLGAGTFLEARTHRYDPMTKPDGTPTYFAREFLEVHLQLGSQRVIQFSAHFRSKASDDPGRRLAEAQTARDILLASAKEFPDAVVVLGGDLNDTPGSEPLEALESAPELLRVASDLPPEQQGTYTWNGQPQAIDHVFLVTSSRGVYVPGSASVVKDPGAPGLASSDHGALIAELGVH